MSMVFNENKSYHGFLNVLTILKLTMNYWSDNIDILSGKKVFQFESYFILFNFLFLVKTRKKI